MGCWNCRIKKPDKWETKKGLWGFKLEQTSSEKNPTGKKVETPVNTVDKSEIKKIKDTELTNTQVEQIVLEKHELNSTGITHKWFAEDSYQQELIRYAYSIGWLDFVKLIECENGQRNPDRKVRDKAGYAYGLCQMNEAHHKIPEEYWKDGKGNWHYQIDYCFAKWKEWTPFYWPSRIIKGQKCANYVSNRFIIK